MSILSQYNEYGVTNVAVTLVTVLISFTVHVVITLVNVEIMIVNV